jgi:hypothetical protein
VSSANRFLFDATSHRCAMPIARSAPTAVSAIEIARAKRTILMVSHRDKDRTQSARCPFFGKARWFDGENQDLRFETRRFPH